MIEVGVIIFVNNKITTKSVISVNMEKIVGIKIGMIIIGIIIKIGITRKL